mmetsp:Transcript_8581/g.31732  ORF Transcript_8581/g.31732 Transcript_8581/m.31732 type:complete len:189 (+) Transcript_8581:1101-1667(+)
MCCLHPLTTTMDGPMDSAKSSQFSHHISRTHQKTTLSLLTHPPQQLNFHFTRFFAPASVCSSLFVFPLVQNTRKTHSAFGLLLLLRACLSLSLLSISTDLRLSSSSAASLAIYPIDSPLSIPLFGVLFLCADFVEENPLSCVFHREVHWFSAQPKNCFIPLFRLAFSLPHYSPSKLSSIPNHHENQRP